MLLGELEKQVMLYIWSAGEADVKQASAVIAKQRGCSLNTVQSTMERLFKKGLLAREKKGHAYVYRAKVAREELIAQLIHNVTDDFIDDGEHSLVAAFSSVSSQLNEADLDELEQLIETQRKMRQRGQQ